MLYPTTTIQPEDRDVDGMYPIASGSMHVFPFRVPYLGKLTLTMKHAFPNSQDWSISVTCLDRLDQPVVFYTTMYEFNLDRAEVVIELQAQGAGFEGLPEFDPTYDYYLTVLNMQNRPNGYQLTFSA